ncbi:MAG TPA: hypothetical protein VFM69_06875 [Pricia sp.]|nr:hypothetical protein [Pricia sp.]
MNQGTSRNERALSTLDPSSVKLDSRTLKDIFEDTRTFAKTVVFEGEGKSYTWKPLFDEGLLYLEGIESGSLKERATKECPPHLALFFSFLNLFSSVQKQLNSLNREHLLFFYKKILRQTTFPVAADQVYTFMELARNNEKYLLEKGTGLLAGKSPNKKDIVYRTQKDVFLNKARITQCKGIYNSKKPWESLYVFEDLPRMYQEFESAGHQEVGVANTGWHPFGNPKLSKRSAGMGFGVCAPVLLLNEGDRIIKITLTLGEMDIVPLKEDPWDPRLWEVHLSTAEGVLIKALSGLTFSKDQLVFTVELGKMEPALMRSEKTTEAVPFSPSPYLKFVLAPGYNHALYELLQKVKVKQIDIRVEAKGLENLIVNNDYGILDIGQAFQPFGFTPVVGSNMYVHASELIRKHITGASISLEWKGLPENLKAYYEGYLGQTNSLVERKEDFKITIAVRKNKEWIPVLNGNEPEFSLFGDSLEFQIDTKYLKLFNEGYDSGNGRIKITFSSPKRAFGHTIYPSVYTKAIMAQAQQKDEAIPNPPYTPAVESIRVDYEAHEEFDLGEEVNNGQQFFYVEPFGYQPLTTLKTPFSLLPPGYGSGGQLYLGVSALSPPEQLSLFFEILEENVEKKPEPLLSYLGVRGWKRFSANQVLSDTTQGLKQTGIITLNIPADATDKGTRMPLGFHWLKLETKTHPERFDRIITVRTNAVLCVLNTNDIHPAYPINNLAPGSISSFTHKKSAIKKIEQPYPAFGGRPPESDSDFYTRISEQLAHKNKGISPWDIEHLVLQQFPDIYQVICNANTNGHGERTAGAIHIITIPRAGRINLEAIQKPLASAALLERIREFLSARMSPHVSLSIGNPSYDELQVHATVSFKDRADAGFYLKKLESDLKRFLSPWAFDREKKMEMGTTLYKSSLIKFIELRPYIGFIAQIKLYKNKVPVETDEIFTDRHTILISSDTHRINTVEPDTILCQTNQGIAQMIIDINFQVE